MTVVLTAGNATVTIHPEQGGRRSIHYVAGGHFFETGAAFEAKD